MIENVNNTINSPNLWPVLRQYPTLKIPDDWATLREFAEWYIKAGKPMLVPWDAEVFRTDDATAICIFRHKRYQVEMYLIHPGYDIPVHSHPGMEVLTMVVGGGEVCGARRPLFGTSDSYGRMSYIKDGEFHGGKPTSDGKGFSLLSFEKWLGDTPMTSAAVEWNGKTAGPIHDELISKRQSGDSNAPTDS